MPIPLFVARYYTEEDLRQCGFKAIGHNVRIHELTNLHGVENIALGSNVRIDAFASIIATGPVFLGAYIHIASYCLLAAGEGIIMNDFSGVAPGVKIFTRSDDYAGHHLTNPTVPEKYTGVRKGQVTLMRHVIIGSQSIVMPGVTIGTGSAVGAFSMVSKNLDEWGIYAGVPAKYIKARSRRLLDAEAALLGKAVP